MTLPNEHGKFGKFGGKLVPETLMTALKELEEQYRHFKENDSFQRELSDCLKNFVGRPTPLYFAERLTKKFGGAKIYLKREDLCHGGAHKINNTVGQVLLAKKMGKKRIIAETGAGQHGVATAIAAAKLDLPCEVYMGTEDIERQKMNVLRMNLLGAKVHPVTTGSKTLKDAINETMRDWVTNIKTSFYCIGSVVGPHPYPMMVRDFQSIIGREIKKEILAKEGRLPDFVIACVGGGSNAMGAFYPFLQDRVQLIGVEAAGKGLHTKKHSAPLNKGTFGALHGAYTYLLQDNFGQVQLSHSVAAGLDYPGVGPELSYLKKSERILCASAEDEEVIRAFKLLAKTEGIIPALESAHALAYLTKLAPTLEQERIIVLNLSGRGDKDLQSIQKREVK